MNVVFLDCTQNYGFQFSAANTKTELLAKGLVKAGNVCTIINGVEGYSGIKYEETRVVDGLGEVVSFPSRKVPVLGFFCNLPSLIGVLKRLAENDGKNVMILTSPYLHIYFIYVILGKVLGYKIVTISHEWLPTIKRRFWIQNVMSGIYAKTFGKGIQGILPISHYIWLRVEHFGKPMLMTPILAEYPEKVPSVCKEDIFVYCVYSYYYRVITMVIDGYKEYRKIADKPYGLILILSGPISQIEKVQDYIREARLTEGITIKTKLPYAELLQAYQQARALLIPLNPDCEQDHARFSQKIAEYLSSGTPVISNRVGEIPYYFENSKNMILTDYSAKGFANSFKWVQDNPIKATEIGRKGFETGVSEFNYETFGKKLDGFLQTIFQ